jgi:hypothetical protein
MKVYKTTSGQLKKIEWLSPLGAKFTYEIHRIVGLYHESFSMYVEDENFDKHREEDDLFMNAVSRVKRSN